MDISLSFPLLFNRGLIKGLYSSSISRNVIYDRLIILNNNNNNNNVNNISKDNDREKKVRYIG